MDKMTKYVVEEADRKVAALGVVLPNTTYTKDQVMDFFRHGIYEGALIELDIWKDRIEKRLTKNAR